jgi:hypothetical protein
MNDRKPSIPEVTVPLPAQPSPHDVRWARAMLNQDQRQPDSDDKDRLGGRPPDEHRAS